MDREDGFTLVEIVCVLAIVGLLAALVLPMFPRATSRSRLEGYALQIAAILKGDRASAIRTGVPVATALNAAGLSVQSGATRERLALPADVGFDALVAERCAGRRAGAAIDFFPTGMSCGGTVEIWRQHAGYQIRVNWLTGGVEIVAVAKP